ncbi:MAG: RNA polymerase subunit sigma, partial [Gemmatimonadaceae bacterium]|nr:RNA polymerase subunit sigma [Gemmatimonadaceae bacterium]
MDHALQREVTRLLEALEQGDSNALDTLFPLVYEELRAVAHRQRRRWQGDDTLNTTALVHEVYL